MSIQTDLMREFIEEQTRRVSRAWISNQSLYTAFLRWVTPDGPNEVVRITAAMVPFQAFSRFLGHNLGIPTVRRWVEGRQVYGRRLWPLEEIRKHLNFGVDFI